MSQLPRCVLLSMSILMALTMYHESSNACTRDPFPVFRAKIYFIAVPLLEMVDTGPNTYGCLQGGHIGGNCPDRILGQEVTVLRIGGSNSGTLSDALKESGNRVVLVPWDDDAACRREVYKAPGLPWLPGKRGLFVAELRPESEWAGSKPTFDVYPAFLEPYPDALIYRNGWRQTRPIKNGDLSVEQYWSLYEALPEYETAKKNPRLALETFNKWVKVHPHLTKRYPAKRIIEEVQWVYKSMNK